MLPFETIYYVKANVPLHISKNRTWQHLVLSYLIPGLNMVQLGIKQQAKFRVRQDPSEAHFPERNKMNFMVLVHQFRYSFTCPLQSNFRCSDKFVQILATCVRESYPALVKAKTCFWNNWIPKVLVQSCYLRLYQGTEIFPVVCCYRWRESMEMD